ncbi:hypothetical protein SLA2020_447150 [Shorea laevis]
MISTIHSPPSSNPCSLTFRISTPNSCRFSRSAALDLGQRRLSSSAIHRRRMEWFHSISRGCFRSKESKSGLRVEHDSGGIDVFDASAAKSGAPPKHLVIMVNGIVGR